jgi:hypothetical protein
MSAGACFGRREVEDLYRAGDAREARHFVAAMATLAASMGPGSSGQGAAAEAPDQAAPPASSGAICAPPQQQPRQRAASALEQARSQLALQEAPTPGLHNEGADYNCFLNAVVQALWRCGAFRQGLLRLRPATLQVRLLPCPLLHGA